MHIILIQLKAIDISIADDSGRCVTLGQRHESLLQTPPHENLIRFRVVLLGDADEGFVLCFFVADERAVGLDDDVVGLAVFDAFALLAPWVELSWVS
jgi:hypothetical protein